jgi:phosphoribosylglycinamide formyltransferase-1
MAIADRIEAGRLDAAIALVVCDVPDAAGIAAARARGLEVEVVEVLSAPSREAHDRNIAAALEAKGLDLVCLAGYMRLLSPWFVERFRGRILNIHPSLLPAFPGVHVQKKALDYGVRVSGCTVHFVDEGLDSGPIILQAPVEVRDDDTPASLSGRILEEEHRLYSEAIALYFAGRLRVEGRRVRILPASSPGMAS